MSRDKKFLERVNERIDAQKTEEKRNVELLKTISKIEEKQRKEEEESER